MTRVLFIYGTDLLHPFPHPRVFFEAEILEELGYEVSIVYWSRNRDSARLSPVGKGIDLHPFITSASPSLRFIGWFLFQLYALHFAKSRMVDVVHVHHWDGLLAGILSKLVLRTELVYDVWELSFGTPLPKHEFYPVRCLERIASSKADALVFPTKNRGKLFGDYYHLSRPWYVISNSLVMRTSELQRQFPSGSVAGLAGDARTKIVVSGILDESRGVFTLLRALSIARNRESMVLLMAGGGNPKFVTRTYEIAEELGIADRILYTGFITQGQLMKSLEICDIGVLLLLPDCLNNIYPAPTKLCHYFDAGLAVIASDFPDLRDLVTKTDSGLVVDPADIVAIARALDFLHENRKTLRDMKVHSRKTGEEFFSRSSQVHSMERIYSTLVKKG
jgi:glycosyltransferase involved in cell wall biosynthesis